MPRFKLKAFDPHNSDAAARTHWERLQRGETKHKYDLPPTQPGKRKKRTTQRQPSSSSTLTKQQPMDDERPSLAQRRFHAQIMAAKGATVQRPTSAPDTETRDKRAMRKEKKPKKAQQDAEPKHNTAKRRRTQTDEDRQADEQRTRSEWEHTVATMKGQRSSPASAAVSLPPVPLPPPPPREFAGVERIPFGLQVDRPPQQLTQLRNKRATAAGGQVGKAVGGLSMEQYAAERQKAQEQYAALRKRRREAEKT